MSYDITIEAPPGDGDPRELWGGNLTYNVHDMLKAAGLRLRDLDSMPASEAFLHIDSALRFLVDYPLEVKALEPDNGWGSYGGLVAFFALFKSACADFPCDIVRIR